MAESRVTARPKVCPTRSSGPFKKTRVETSGSGQGAEGLTVGRTGSSPSSIQRRGWSNDLVRSVTGDRDGSLWIGTSLGGIDRYRDGKFTPFAIKDGLSDSSIRCIYEGDDGSLWIGTNAGGLNRLKDGKVTPYTTK